jgi:hypothetical protein
MPLQCEFTGGVQITHLSLRKTDPNDADTLAADVKMIGFVEASILPTLLCCAATEVQNLWHYDDDQTPRFPMIEKVQLTNVYKAHYLILRGHQFVGVDIKKLSYSAADHRRIELTFSATIAHPSDPEVMLLTELLQDSASCEIDCDPDLFSEQEENERRSMGMIAKELPAEDQDEMDFSSGVYDADPMYSRAVDAVRDLKKATISSLQRKLKIGYNRAARLLEAMEFNRVVSVPDGYGARTVFGATTEEIE